MLKRALGAVRSWYDGRPISHDDPPRSSVVLIGFAYRRHWTAAVARSLVSFWLRHWQWIIGTVIAVAGLLAVTAR